MKEQILSRAKQLQPELLEIRRDLHRHPETGFDLTYTKVKELLTKHRSSLGVFLMLSKGKNMKEKAPDAGADSLSKYGFATLII